MTVITTAQDLKGTHKDVRRAIHTAIEAGWTCHRASNGSIKLVPPDNSGEKPVHIPTSSRAWSGLKSLQRAIGRTLTPEQLISIAAYVEETPGLDVDDTIVGHANTAVDKEEPVTITQPVAIARKPTIPTITSTTPWLAKRAPRKNGGIRYPSAAVLERHWSNGVIDYVCAYPDCDWDSNRPQSVSAHYGHAHNRGKGTQPQPKPTTVDPTYTEPTNPRYQPTARLVATLADWLTGQSWDNTDELAALFLTWAHERPDLEHATREPEEMTPEMILDRIRLLVGSDPLERKVTEMQQMIDTAARELDDALSEVERLTTERQALRDLLA